jgi:hypothetical protein
MIAALARTDLPVRPLACFGITCGVYTTIG